MLPELESRLRDRGRSDLHGRPRLRSHRARPDHTREYVPFLHLGPGDGGMLGDVDGLDLVGRTVKRGAAGVRLAEVFQRDAASRNRPDRASKFPSPGRRSSVRSTSSSARC